MNSDCVEQRLFMDIMPLENARLLIVNSELIGNF